MNKDKLRKLIKDAWHDTAALPRLDLSDDQLISIALHAIADEWSDATGAAYDRGFDAGHEAGYLTGLDARAIG